MFKKKIIALFASSMILPLASLSCTNVPVKATDGSIVVARTLEFGPAINSNVMSSPRGRVIQTSNDNNINTMNWTSKYGYLYADYFNTGYSVDGMNEKGLSFGYLYLPSIDTQYMNVAKGEEKMAVPYTQFGDWILGNFSSVAEVKAALKNVYIYSKNLTVNGKATVFPLHAVIIDKSGKSIIIEFIQGKLNVYDSNDGIMTNSPQYPWQVVNLRNYLNLSPYSPERVNYGDITYEVTGQGSGMNGLPGDYSPPSRFVKMSILQKTAMPVDNANGALTLAQHIINNVFIPYGAARGVKGTPDTYDNLDKTQWVVFKDITHNKFYFKSYGNPTIEEIDMNKVDLSKGAPQLSMPMAQDTQYIPDVTDKFLLSKGR